MSQYMESSVERMAEHYVNTIYSPANGHGQHVSPHYGQSHNIIRKMNRLFGADTTDKALTMALENRALHRALDVALDVALDKARKETPGGNLRR